MGAMRANGLRNTMTRQFALLALAFACISMICSQLLIKARFTVLDIAGQLAADPLGAAWTVLRDVPLLVGFALLVTGAALWYSAMTRLPLGFMMPLAAMIMPMVVVGAALFLGEPLSAQKAAAIAVITAGTIWLGLLHQT